MPTRLPSGAAVRLLAVMCVTAGCAAAQQQQQQQPSAVFSTTPDELLHFIEQAVRLELQPHVSRLESKIESLKSRFELRIDALDSRLESRVNALDSRLVLLDSRVDAPDSRLVKLDSRVDELTVRLFDNSQNPQPDELSSRLDGQQSKLDKLVTKVDGQKSSLDMLITKVDNQTSQLNVVVAKMDSQQSQLAVLTDTSSSEQSRLDGAINSTANQQTQVAELAVRLDQVEGEGGPGGSESLPRDCGDLPAGAQSALTLLQPGLDRSLPPVIAYCDIDTDGGHWTVIQRRAEVEPHQDFFLGWAEYKEGFGALRGEFWWGLEKLWRMTSAQDRQYQLRIDMEDFEGNKRHAVYQGFQISSEQGGYQLGAGNYSGDAGDSLSIHVNMKFSTHDRDQDGASKANCAQLRKGGWWYINCGHSNLNGRYQNNHANDEGIWWQTWKGWNYSLKKAEMKIRRI